MRERDGLVGCRWNVVGAGYRVGMSAYRSTGHVVYGAKYHIIWCPKCRRCVLRGGVDDRLKTIIVEVCGDLDAEVIEVDVMSDHVHLLVEVPPVVPLPKLLKHLKGRSSRLFRQEYPRLRRLPTLWTRSAFVSTVGGAPLEIVRQYVTGTPRDPPMDVA